MGRRSNNNLIDWPPIEKDYRIGHTLQSICDKHGIAMSSLTLHIAEEGWTRDLTDTVKAATRAAIIAERVERAREVTEQADQIGAEIGRKIGEQAQKGLVSDVQAAAAVGVVINRRHQDVAGKLVEMAGAVHDELAEFVGKKAKSIDALVAAVAENSPETADSLRRVLSMSSRAATLDKLASAATKAIAIERQAYGLSDKPVEKDESMEDAILRILGGA